MDEVLCSMLLPESSEEQSSPLSTLLRSPIGGQRRFRDVIHTYLPALSPAVCLLRTPVLHIVPGGSTEAGVIIGSLA